MEKSTQTQALCDVVVSLNLIAWKFISFNHSLTHSFSFASFDSRSIFETLSDDKKLYKYTFNYSNRKQTYNIDRIYAYGHVNDTSH